MKQVLAIMVSVVLTLCLLGCAGAEPVLAAPRPAGEPSTAATAPEPEEGAPLGSQYQSYQRLAGVYRRTDLPADSGYEEILQIFPVGDILLLERSAWADGSILEPLILDEFWSEPDATAEEGDICLSGRIQTFSPAFSLEDFCTPALDCTIRETQEGITITREGEASCAYAPDPRHTGAHRTVQECLAQLGNAAGKPEAVGTWARSGEQLQSVLMLGEDGSFTCLEKYVHAPARLLIGGWTFDSDTGFLLCAAEQVGYSNESLDFRLNCKKDEADILRISDPSGEILDYAGDVQDFYACTWEWTSGYTPEQLLCRVAAQIHVSDSYTDADGETREYRYRLPEILCQESDTELMKMNREIQERFAIGVSESLTSIYDGDTPSLEEADYMVGQYDGMVSLLVWSRPVGGNAEFASYCYDSQTGKRLDNRQLLARLGITEKQHLEALRAAASDAFLWDNAERTGDANYRRFQKQTAQGGKIDVDLPVMVDDFGELVAAVPVASLDGGWYNALVYPYSGAKG